MLWKGLNLNGSYSQIHWAPKGNSHSASKRQPPTRSVAVFEFPGADDTGMKEKDLPAATRVVCSQSDCSSIGISGGGKTIINLGKLFFLFTTSILREKIKYIPVFASLGVLA